MKDRKRKKLEDIHNIIIRDEKVGYTATIKDVSKSGMSILCEHVFPTYKLVDILIKIGEKPLQLKGSIRWVKEPLPELEEKFNEIGISLINPPAEFIKFFEIEKE
jgi:hypothetical protein